MQPEETGWISTETVLRMLGVRHAGLRRYLRSKRLTPHRSGRRNYYRVEEVEALVRRPDRLRRQASKERRMGRQQWGRPDALPNDRITVPEAATRLGVSQGMVKKLVYKGQLVTYQAVRNGSQHWFSAADVEALRIRREEKRAERERARQEAAQVWRPVHERWRTRRVLPSGGRVEVGDIAWWERHFGEWLTTRQAAWMLHTTQRSITTHRQNGRLMAKRFRNDMSHRVQWHYPKEEVLALMNDRERNRRRANYERYLSPEGRAERAAEAARQREAEFRKQVEEIAELNRKGVARAGLERILSEQW